MYRSRKSGIYHVQDRYITGREYRSRFSGAIAETRNMVKGLWHDCEYALAAKAAISCLLLLYLWEVLFLMVIDFSKD
ncbi:MAG: hypothetical protein HY831_00535 [Candidatus Aenigmarchaeota archaeon]|nr:hypothetical protein [Candidatus Aenigmarchaeota archaeon]